MIARFVIIASLLASASDSCTAGNEAESTAQLADKTPKVAVALMDLHVEYWEYLEHGGDHPFSSAQRNLTIIDDRVLIDATAASNAGQLIPDLVNLGCVGAAVAASIVSCQLPIQAIPELTKLESLGFARPSRAMARNRPPVSR